MARKRPAPSVTEAQSEFVRETRTLLAEILANCPELTEAMRAERARQARIRRRLREVPPLSPWKREDGR